MSERIDIDAILASLGHSPDDLPADPWGGANLANCGGNCCTLGERRGDPSQLLEELERSTDSIREAERLLESGWTVDPHDSTADTLAVERAADELAQLLGDA